MPIGYCAYTGVPIESSSDGVWDDDEWISWQFIYSLPQPGESDLPRPTADPELRQLFEVLVHTAAAYKQHTGRYLDIFGELGEFYAELKIGLRRHKANTPGSDGKVGNDFVEVKTISPDKRTDKVQVKRSGNFNKLYVVRISENFFFEGRLINRRDLCKGSGQCASVRFGEMPSNDD